MGISYIVIRIEKEGKHPFALKNFYPGQKVWWWTSDPDQAQTFYEVSETEHSCQYVGNCGRDAAAHDIYVVPKDSLRTRWLTPTCKAFIPVSR